LLSDCSPLPGKRGTIGRGGHHASSVGAEPHTQHDLIAREQDDGLVQPGERLERAIRMPRSACPASVCWSDAIASRRELALLSSASAVSA
jgi:hypothetical protein